MTQVTITDADLGNVVAINGMLDDIEIVALSSWEEYRQYFTLVEDMHGFEKVLFSIDPSTSNVTLGTNLISGGKIPFSNLTVRSIPTGSSFLIDYEPPLAPPANTSLPNIGFTSGSGEVGSVIICATGSWSGSPTTYDRQWLRNGAVIAGATGESYTSVVADAGTSISCRVTATNDAGSGSATSNTLTIQGVPVNSVAPVVTPTAPATVGDTLTTTNGTWSNSPTSYTYQWARGGSEIPGATASTYVVVTTDQTAGIVSCWVSASNVGGIGAFAESNAVAIT